jgi:uncharacterized membrane protein
MVMNFLPARVPIDHDRVIAAIQAAERRTSGEIRVVVSPEKTEEPVALAQREFERLGMTKTAARNGVLILIAPATRQFAVVGDAGVHEKCGDTFWSEVAAAMAAEFQRGDFTAGLVLGIERCGTLLAEHFPRTGDDKNELPDEIG